MSAPTGVNPLGPVFLSYRQRDGTPTATALSWLLRAAGVPVWHDRTDLPPGDTNDRLDEALAQGLSGAVLIVTPNIVESGVVRTVEVDRLLALEKDRAFVMAVANRVRNDKGKVDYDAPDDLLGKPNGTLGRLNQRSAFRRDGLVTLTRQVLAHRADWIRRMLQPGEPLTISVQTRTPPRAFTPDPAHLVMRLRPAKAGRLPSPDGLKDLASTLGMLPDAVGATGASAVRITGGAHLTVALAVGCALPTTLIGKVDAVDTQGDLWTSGTVSTPPGSNPRTQIEGHGMLPIPPAGQRRAVLAYVDLLPDRSDAAYTRLLHDSHQRFVAWQHIRPTSTGPLDPADAGPVVQEVASRLRTLSQQHDNADLHLALRSPYPVAVLLGRLLNTLKIVAYEWTPAPAADPDTRPLYVPALELTPTDARGPITAVLLTKT